MAVAHLLCRSEVDLGVGLGPSGEVVLGYIHAQTAVCQVLGGQVARGI